jgi:hypothetical protein
MGISGTGKGHLDLDMDNFVAYAYGPPSSVEPLVCWPTYLNPIEIGTGLSVAEREEIPDAFHFLGNAPNPFNPLTRISFVLPERSHVSLRIYDLKGKLIRDLLAQELTQGSHVVTWKGKDNEGLTVGSGVYFVALEAGKYRSVSKMVMLK